MANLKERMCHILRSFTLKFCLPVAVDTFTQLHYIKPVNPGRNGCISITHSRVSASSFSGAVPQVFPVSDDWAHQYPEKKVFPDGA